MEKHFESWFQNQQIDWKSTNLNSSFGNMISSNGKEQLPVTGSKKFLVFDQSNNRTTLIYSSIHIPKPQSIINPKNENTCFEKHESFRFSNPFLDSQNDLKSEMREDTEELNALLYSDDDENDYSEDEEEQSTGHSPNPIPGFDLHEFQEKNDGKVESSSGYRKRHKLENGGYDVVSLEDTASSAVNCSGNNGGFARKRSPENESESESGKRLRKDKVKETISVLENLIPGGKNGKDAMMILDEAINYLMILKVKAKALGLDSL